MAERKGCVGEGLEYRRGGSDADLKVFLDPPRAASVARRRAWIWSSGFPRSLLETGGPQIAEREPV